MCTLFLPAHYYTTYTRVFIHLTAPSHSAVWVKNSLSLCLIWITQPSHTYKGSCISHLSTYILPDLYTEVPQVLYRTKYKVIHIYVLHLTRKPVACRSSLSLILPALYLIWITHLRASSVSIPIGCFCCHHTKTLSKCQQASKACVVSLGFFKLCTSAWG